jgi:hypothetical protein
VVNSVVQTIAKDFTNLVLILAVTIILAALRHGWRVAVFDLVSVGEKPMSINTILKKGLYTYMIFMQHFFTYSESTMND